MSCVGRGCYEDPREDIGRVGEDRGVYSKGEGWESNLPHFKSGGLTDGLFHSRVSDMGVT